MGLWGYRREQKRECVRERKKSPGVEGNLESTEQTNELSALLTYVAQANTRQLSEGDQNCNVVQNNIIPKKCLDYYQSAHISVLSIQIAHKQKMKKKKKAREQKTSKMYCAGL